MLPPPSLSVFDREDTSAQERRQAERRKELMRAQTLPKTSAAQSRRAMIEKLEKETGGYDVPVFEIKLMSLLIPLMPMCAGLRVV